MHQAKHEEIERFREKVPFIFDPITGKVRLLGDAASGFLPELRYLRLKVSEINSIERLRALVEVICDPEVQDLLLPFGEYDSASSFNPCPSI